MCEVSLVCPVYNEYQLIEQFAAAATKVLRNTSESFEIVFVDDGSQDETWTEIIRLGKIFPEVRGVRLSKNYGKEIALTAGLANARGLAHIPIDVDFQDPIELVPTLIGLWRGGIDHVIPRRIDRADKGLRLIGAGIFYKIIGWLTLNSVPKDVGDFRLLDAKITTRFLEFKEAGRVNKVIFSELGGSQKFVEFSRPIGAKGRKGGQSFSKLMDLGISAVSSNSARLSKSILVLGVAGFMVGITSAIAVLVAWLAGFIEVPGQATVLMAATVIVSVQLITGSFLGILVAESLRESQQRPKYFVEELS